MPTTDVLADRRDPVRPRLAPASASGLRVGRSADRRRAGAAHSGGGDGRVEGDRPRAHWRRRGIEAARLQDSSGTLSLVSNPSVPEPRKPQTRSVILHADAGTPIEPVHGSMLPMIVFVAVVCGLVLRRLSQEERIQLFHRIIELARQGATTARDALTRTPPGCDEFYAALRARTRWTLITPAIIAGFVAVHVLMRWNASGDVDDQLLLEWGASVGPLTTNAEWSRLASAMFIHRGWLHLIADTAGLLMAGALIERVVGRAAFTLDLCRRGTARRVVESGRASDIGERRRRRRSVRRLRLDGRHDGLGLRAAVSIDDSRGRVEACLARGGGVRHLPRRHRRVRQRVDASRSAGRPGSVDSSWSLA